VEQPRACQTPPVARRKRGKTRCRCRQYIGTRCDSLGNGEDACRLTRREALTGLSTVLALAAASSVRWPPPRLPNRTRSGSRGSRATSTAPKASARFKRLQHAWALYVDLGAWDRAAALFADDAELAHGDDRYGGVRRSATISCE
jgi:hypothetical protein